MKRHLILVLVFSLLLLSGCQEQPHAPNTNPPVSQTDPGQTTPTEPADSLSALRAAMMPPVMAVADFGFPELSEDFGIMDYLLDEYPQWLSEHDFVANIPEDRIIRTCGYDDWGILVCVVPRDPKSSIRVKVMQHMDEEPYWKETVVYRSDSGEPILLLANTSESMPITVEVIDSEGRGADWRPYWENCDPIPEGDYGGAHVMYFTPESEKTPYQRALEQGWVVPDEAFYRNHLWESFWSYRLELFYDPGQIYDGSAFIYEYDWTEEDGDYTITYQGSWSYGDGNLCLKLTDSDGDVVDLELSILTHPEYYGWLCIFPGEEDECLPVFAGSADYDELSPLGSDATSPYENALYAGFRKPKVEDLVNTAWESFWDYAMDLNDDGVPGDNGGDLVLYDVNKDGGYTQSYTGTWRLEEDMLHLLLIPTNENGVFIDDSFPVLIRDEELWIGRNEQGNCLPWFYDDVIADTLVMSKG